MMPNANIAGRKKQTQCYEYQMMLAYVHDAIEVMQLNINMDSPTLADILDRLCVENMTELQQVDIKNIRVQALGEVVEFSKAA